MEYFMENVTYEALGALLLSLSKDRKFLIKQITQSLVSLHLPKETCDAILAAIIVQVSEIQFAEDNGAKYESSINMLEILLPIFNNIKEKSNINKN